MDRQADSLETAWQAAAASLISDMRTELVNVTPLQVAAASRRSSSLPSFIRLELETVSRQIETVSAVTRDLALVLDGHAAATPPAVDALNSVASHRLPLEIASNSGRDLSGWMSDLRQRLLKLPVPGADEDCAVFDVSVFSRPEGFLDALVRHLARQQFKSLHSVHLFVDAVRITACSWYFTPGSGAKYGFQKSVGPFYSHQIVKLETVQQHDIVQDSAMHAHYQPL